MRQRNTPSAEPTKWWLSSLNGRIHVRIDCGIFVLEGCGCVSFVMRPECQLGAMWTNSGHNAEFRLQQPLTTQL
ncbi:hypothetical protein TZ00_18335 [Agreia bicolorata]|uniref:Uncharacterized protein n=1 Tax=Agreia bicolorata TaxID=110935 RepID=A0ABR5CB29_9MICO|nr:hypothetical protein TZ00_18335 [Agreia bicolorata]